MFSKSIKWYIESILKNQGYIHGILNDTLKVYNIVYQKHVKKEYQQILYTYSNVCEKYVTGLLYIYIFKVVPCIVH